MNKLFFVLILVLSIGTVMNLLIQSVNAWHAEFPSKGGCRKAVNETTDNKPGEANRVLRKPYPT